MWRLARKPGSSDPKTVAQPLVGRSTPLMLGNGFFLEQVQKKRRPRSLAFRKGRGRPDGRNDLNNNEEKSTWP